MDLKHFYNVPTTREIGQYGLIKFTPINPDYFIRLQEWHDKSFTDVQQALAGASEDKKGALLLQDALIAMLHTATYPYVKDSHKSEDWQKVCWGWSMYQPKLIEWFLEYFQSFLPETNSKGK